MREVHRCKQSHDAPGADDDRRRGAVAGGEALHDEAHEQEQDEGGQGRAEQADLPGRCERHVRLGLRPGHARRGALDEEPGPVQDEVPGQRQQVEAGRLGGVVVTVHVGSVPRPVAVPVDVRLSAGQGRNGRKVGILVRAGLLHQGRPREREHEQ